MRRTAEERRAFVQKRAAEMEANPTEAEARMWEILEPMGGWLQQCGLEGRTKNGGEWNYIVDFYNPQLCLAIEVDGSSHRKKKGRDRRRDTRLQGEGIRTIRFSNQQVMDHPNIVAFKVKFELACLKDMQKV